MPNLRNGSKGGFEPVLTRLRVRQSTTELPRSTVSNLLKFVLFADDANTFCSSTSLHDLQDTINRELAKCGSRLIDDHYICGKQIACCSAVDRLIMSSH